MSAAPRRRRLGAGLRTAVATLGGAAALAVAVGALAHPAFATQPIAVGARVIAGPAAPGSGPTALSGSIARDGTGALVFLAPVGGVQHVYVSALLNGAFLAPVRVDGALAGASSEPQVAAGPGGALVVAFLNAGSLYVAGRRSAFAALAAPHALAAGAGNLALAMSPFGKTYLAFTVADGAGTDVRVAFQGAAGWGLEPGPLNVARGDDAGTGAGHPAVTAAGDGVGIVA